MTAQRFSFLKVYDFQLPNGSDLGKFKQLPIAELFESWEIQTNIQRNYT